MNTNLMSENLQKQAAQILNQIKPKENLGKELFEAIARLYTTSTVEAVVLKKEKDQTYVWLSKRSNSDCYAGEWHCPGTIIRKGELEIDSIKRVLKNEMGTTIKNQPKYVGHFFHDEARGWFQSIIYTIEIKSDPTKAGQWWPINKLPVPLVKHHKDRILPAVKNKIK